MHEYDFTASANYVTKASVSVLQNLAYEMNRRWPVFAQAIQALEVDGLPGGEVDDLMEGVFIVWHATVKTAHLRLPKLTPEDIQRHIEHFAGFLAYHQGETELEERRSLQFIQHPQLEAFTATRLREIYGELSRVPAHVSTLYFALMKCFDQAIADRERHCREHSSR